jgi:hypothetical protein
MQRLRGSDATFLGKSCDGKVYRVHENTYLNQRDGSKAEEM